MHGLRNRTTMQERVWGEVGSNSLRSQPDFDKISTQHQIHQIQNRESPICFLESRTLWWMHLDFYNQTLTRYPHNTIIQKQRSWVWAQGIKAEYSSRNTVFGAKKLGLSLNSFAVATRRWPTCDHHHHPLISVERQSISARLRELGVKRLALSAPCSLRSQPDGS